MLADPDPLVGLELAIDAFAERVGATPIRWWRTGLGWFCEVRFATLATGRPFVAVAELGQDHGVGIHKHTDDPWKGALIDLFEHFAIDERDTIMLHPAVDLAELPVWALWREDDNANKFEMDRYRSYAKATRDEQIYRDRGHRQFYWVDPVGK